MAHGRIDRAASYRRGAVMGLTVAEAFMLIAFVLLMLLGVWMATARDRIAALEARAEEAERFADAFTEEEKAAALVGREHLAELGQDLAKLAGFREMAAAGASPVEAARALELLPALAEGHSAEELLDRARLLDEAMVAEVAEAALALPPDARRALVDLARMETLPDLAALLEEQGVEGLRAAARADPDGSEAARDLAAYRATGVAPEAVEALVAARDRAVSAELDAAMSRARIAAEIAREAGPLVAPLGGEVRPDGTIVFRDRLLFQAGSARITPAFDATLAGLCRPWIEVLHAQRDGLSAVRIEGHASSEWREGTEAAEGFARNLDLSQARAAAVFKRCLAHSGEDAVAEWARTRMTAVGHSSARPVLGADGAEDRAASRRVVFAIETAAPVVGN